MFEDIACNDITKINKESVLEIIKKVKEIFLKEDQLIDISKSGSVFAGDTHGDHKTSKKIIDKYLKDDKRVVFLGDYVDRPMEKYGDIKNVLYLFCKKILSKNLILLRGNHEEARVNKMFNFYDNVVEVFGKDVWTKFNDAFSCMPLAVHNKDVIGLHGGLPDIRSLQDINKIKKYARSKDDPRVAQILWNDCVDKDEDIIMHKSRGIKNTFVYGRRYFDDVMQRFDKKVLIRGHDYRAKGKMFNGRMITLFSSERYSDIKGIDIRSDKKIRGCIVAIVPEKIESLNDIKIDKV